MAMAMADRISILPDSIICHIISFLPVEQAIATSVLSKRWTPLWLAIPTLNFDDSNYQQNQLTYFRFLQLVYNVILLRDVEQPIQKFHLNCNSSFCDSSTVKTWISAVVQRKVEHLSISLSNTNLSFDVFTSTTLVVLKLRGISLKSVSSVSFPSLKKLHVILVSFKGNRCIDQILSACPVLEVLVMEYLIFSNNDRHYKYAFHLPKLIKVDISDSGVHFPLESFYNAEFLRIKVYYYGDIPNFSNLTYLDLYLIHRDGWNWLICLMCSCPNLQNLVINEVNTLIGLRHPQCVPKCLISKLKRFSLLNYIGNDNELRFARFILQNARVLRKVTICSITYSKAEENLQMLKDLSLSPRASVTCELSFK